LSRKLINALIVKTDYRKSLPDTQNAGASTIQGANVPLPQVGISNFQIPLRYLSAKGETLTLETSVTGTVSLAADRKGINMSRIMRFFYEFKDRTFTPELLEEILLAFKEHIGSGSARLKLGFRYPILRESLRSGLEGFQFYDVAFEGTLDEGNRFRKRIHFDFVYSSACPCSAELADHARETRAQPAIPHSQRSKARVSVEPAVGKSIHLEELRDLCDRALRTETQVMVRREDEQAFAELNGDHTKFVEDAARLLFESLAADERITDFQVVCAHLESLHNHDAVAVVTKGVEGGFDGKVDDFRSLVC